MKDFLIINIIFVVLKIKVTLRKVFNFQSCRLLIFFFLPKKKKKIFFIPSMENSDFSSCSFETEVQEMPDESPSKAIPQTEAVLLENQRLQQMNSQLQDSINTIKTQLKDALDAVEKSKGVSQQIQVLRNQLQDTISQKELIQKQLTSKTDNDQDVQRIKSELAKVTQDRDDLAQTLLEKENLITKLKKEKQSFKSADAEKTQLIDLLSQSVQKEKANRKKQKKKLIQTTDELLVYKNKADQMDLLNQQTEEEKKRLIAEIDDLKFKMESQTAIINEQKVTISTQESEIIKKNNALNSVQKLLANQKQEFVMYEQQRNIYSNLLAKMNKLAILSDSVIENLQNELTTLKNQNEAKQAKKEIASLNQTSILDLKLPFNDELREQCDKFMKLPQYDPSQRLQLVLNEVGKQLQDKEKECADLNKKIEQINYQHKHGSGDEYKYKQITHALLKDLKNIAVTETKIAASSLCQNDQQFIQFVSQESAKIDPLYAEDVKKDPLFIPDDFFSMEDAAKKKEIIENIVGDDKTTGALFTAQFLTNIVLRKQLSEVFGPLNQYEELSKLSLAHGEDIVDLPEIVKSQREQIEKLKDVRKKMHETIKKLQALRAEDQKRDNDQKTQISTLQLQLDSLQRDNDVLKMRAQVLQNEMALKQENAKDATDALKQETINQQIISLNKDLERKNKENQELSKVIKDLEKSVSDNVLSQQKHTKKIEENYQKQIKDLQQAYSDVVTKSQEKRKQAKKNILSLKAQYEESLQQITQNYEDIRKTLDDNIKDLTQKLADSRDANQRMQDSLKSLELKNEQMEKLNQSYIEKEKESDAELIKIKSEFTKEKQMLQAKLTTTQFNAETQIHDKVRAAELKCNARVNSIINTMLDTLGDFYNVDDTSLSEENIPQLLNHAKEDLERLRYFQMENILNPTKNLQNQEKAKQ